MELLISQNTNFEMIMMLKPMRHKHFAKNYLFFSNNFKTIGLGIF